MGLTDLDCAILLQQQYDGALGIFDKQYSIRGVDFAVKTYKDCVVFAFEGSHNLADWLSNFEAAMIRPAKFGGVELGFYTGIPECSEVAKEWLEPGKKVWCIGHSRGAAHAHIFARALIIDGVPGPDVHRVVFGSPNPGDTIFAAGLVESPVRSYRNYRNILEQDFVCAVPEPLPVVAPYCHPGERIIIDVPGPLSDPWGPLRRHHLYLYHNYLVREKDNG